MTMESHKNNAITLASYEFFWHTYYMRLYLVVCLLLHVV